MSTIMNSYEAAMHVLHNIWCIDGKKISVTSSQFPWSNYSLVSLTADDLYDYLSKWHIKSMEIDANWADVMVAIVFCNKTIVCGNMMSDEFMKFIKKYCRSNRKVDWRVEGF